MALTAAVHREGYTYHEDILTMDKETIAKSKEQFSALKEAGIITDGCYGDSQWVLSDEVTLGITISFCLDEVHFARETSRKLNCTLSQYQQAMRIVVTSQFGFSVRTLQANALSMRRFADTLEIPTDYTAAQALADLLCLLPGESAFRTETISAIDDISPLQQRNQKQRRLAHYQSYLRFLDILDDYWDYASSEEQILYFPVWYWFKVTGILPLRPTECVLTPRKCIRKENGRYYLTVRRTKLKGKKQECRYSIAEDFEQKEYPIPDHLAKPILSYIAATEEMYESDIDVLFCKTAQFVQLDVYCDNNHHYSYQNLRQCLSSFYREVVSNKYKCDVIADRDLLVEGEIEKIRLGDTRHIAMISLAISGSNPTICKELAGHESIEMSSHYYTNLTEFLDVLGYERYRANKVKMSEAYGVHINTGHPVERGYCQCELVWGGNYAECSRAVNSNGMPGECSVCKWYAPRLESLNIKLPALCNRDGYGDMPKCRASLELEQTCTLLKQAIDQLRQGMGNADTVSCMLDKLAAQCQQYVQASTIERMIFEKEEFQYG